MPTEDFNELITEVKLLRKDFGYIREAMIRASKSELEIFNRLREIETTLASMQASAPTKISGWSIGAVLITAALAAITFIEKLTQ